MNPEFVWWKGKVEDLTDPLEMGRVKVRILGYHSDDTSQIPTSDLPFAYPAMPINSRPSDAPIGPAIGTWVMGFFADGKDAQQPIMTHIIDAGYKNDNEPIPPENAPSWGGKRNISTGEVNVNRLARGETSDTYISGHTPKKGIAVAGKLNKSYSEPSLSGGEYPYNKVEESQSGHVFEVDDTPNKEKITRIHKDGTMEVITGNHRLVKVKGDDYELIVDGKSKHLYAEGNVNVTADGDVNIKGRYIRLEGTQIRMKGNLGVLIESPTGAFVSAPFLSTDPKLGGAIMHGGTGQPLVVPAGIPPESIMGPDLPSLTSAGLPSTGALKNLRNAVSKTTSSLSGITNTIQETSNVVNNVSRNRERVDDIVYAKTDSVVEKIDKSARNLRDRKTEARKKIGDSVRGVTGHYGSVKDTRRQQKEPDLEIRANLPTVPEIPTVPQLPDFSFPNPLVAMRQAIFSSFKLMGNFSMCKTSLIKTWLRYIRRSISMADLLRLMLNQEKESDMDDSNAAMIQLMAESLLDEEGEIGKSEVVLESESDIKETIETPITFTDENGDVVQIGSFDEALKLIVEGRVPNFVEDELVSNIAEFGNADGTEKVIIDEVITDPSSTAVTIPTESATDAGSTSSDKLVLGKKPELADCEDDC